MTKLILCLIASALIFSGAMADDVPPQQVDPKLIERRASNYPYDMQRKGEQGWVDIAFVISPEGEVVEPVIDASSGQRAFERAALKSIKDWRFEPARRDGKAVPRRSRTRIEFVLEGSQIAVSQSFLRRYRKIERALERDDLESAGRYLERVFESERLTLGELAYLWAMRARITGMQGNEKQTLIALRQALAASSNSISRENWIPRELEADLLRASFALELNNGYFAVALDVYDRLKDIDGDDSSELKPFVDEVMALIESDKLIATQAVIGEGNSCETCATRWRHELLRRSVEITDIDGELESIDFRCDWARFTDAARDGVGWELPENWGDCSVVVTGATGATFKLVELPPL